jgi:hypothetical protein
MTQDEDRSVVQFRQRVLLLYVLKFSLAALTIWAFLFGTAVLALRVMPGLSRVELLWGLASMPLALMPAVILAWRHRPALAAVRALLDRHGRCGGLLMAGADHPLGEWEERLPEVRQPGLQWRGRRSGLLFACATAFVLLAFLLPQSLANLGGSGLDVAREAEKLARQIDVLEQENVLEKKRAGELKTSLEQVRRDARGKDPVKTLESLDHLQDVANKAAQDASESAARKMEELGRAEAFAEAMEKIGNKMDPAQLADAMNEMAALAKKALNEKELLETGLDKETLDAIKKGTLSPQQAKKLLEALKNVKESTKGKIGRLVKAQLLKAEDLEKCEKAGKCDCEGLAAYLKENGAKSELTDALAMADEGGRGGVTRGPGAAKLDFGDESNKEGVKFKEEELPAADLKAMKETTLSGLSTARPQKGKEKPGDARAGALTGAKSGGGSASTQVVLPRHRGAVERYFERPAKK